jgi:cytoskeleton-associated protein 5
MHGFLGPALGDMLRADVKPALMAAIEEKFKECPQQAPDAFAPARTSRAAGGSGGGGGGGSKKKAAGSGGGELQRWDVLVYTNCRPVVGYA